MINYQNGKIYKLVSNHTDKVYIGSTTQPLHKRFHEHKAYLNSGRLDNTSRTLFELGEVDIVLVEEYPCRNKIELHRQERYWIENTNCVNKYIPTPPPTIKPQSPPASPPVKTEEVEQLPKSIQDFKRPFQEDAPAPRKYYGFTF